MKIEDTELAGREFERILLIKLSALGDVVHTIALLNALRRRYPRAQIDWLTKPSAAGLIRHHPAVTNVLVYGESHTEAPQYNWDGVKHFLRLVRDTRFLGLLRRLRQARYDLVIDVHGQFKSGFVSVVTGAATRIGFERPRPEVWQPAGTSLPPGTIERAWKGAREGAWHAYTHHIRLDRLDIHAVDRYLKLGEYLGFQAAADFSFPIPPEADARIDALFGANGWPASVAPILISPAALWETKRWRSEGFAEVARRMLSDGRAVAIIGAPNEQEECRSIASAAPGAVDLAGKTSLVELAALIRRSALCITNDSGPMHMAVALGRPVVSVFGPTHPVWVGPYGRESAVVRVGTACSPCYLRTYKRCEYDHACMRDVSAEAVIARIEVVLSTAEHRSH